MKKFLTLITLIISTSLFSQEIWINEFHYDNIGTDQYEMIEVVIYRPSNYDLNLLVVHLYNGNGGLSYSFKSLNQFILGDTINDYHIYYYEYPTNGIQNGPDGIAISYNGVLIPNQLISYESQLLINGVYSEDVGIEESNDSDVSGSIQLIGEGSEYSDFGWSYDESTPGYMNIDQSIEMTIDTIQAYYDSLALLICSQYGHYYSALWTDVWPSGVYFSYPKSGWNPCYNLWATYTKTHIEIRTCIVCGHSDTLYVNDLLPLEYDSVFIVRLSCDTASYYAWPENYGIPDSISSQWPELN